MLPPEKPVEGEWRERPRQLKTRRQMKWLGGVPTEIRRTAPAPTQIGCGAHRNAELSGTTAKFVERHLPCGARECPARPSVLGEVLEKFRLVLHGPNTAAAQLACVTYERSGRR